MEHRIEFFSEDIDFSLNSPEQVSEWIAEVIAQNEQELISLTYVFCSDEYLHQMNVEYLNHDTLTDIITFNNADEEGTIEGDIFISVDRVRDNAVTHATSFEDELHRVIIHGALHLIGFDDKNNDAQTLMRKQEDSCLSLRKF